MSLKSIQAAFRDGKIDKPEYILQMHSVHATLYEYAEFLKDTDIAKIEISDGAVTMTSREDGITMICDPSDHRIAPIEILNFASYERKDFDAVSALVDPGSIVFDIGANIGWYSIALSKRVKDLQILAFEPLPKTYGYLKQNLELNHTNNIRALNFGLGKEEEEKIFYFYPAGSGNASLANLTSRKDVEEVHCQVKVLDKFVSERNLGVDFIKCDVEGAELFVFEGGLDTLRKNKPIIFTEILRKWSAGFGYHPNQIINLLAEQGYRCLSFAGDRMQEFHQIDDATIQTNFFFLHKVKHHEKIARLIPGL